MKTFYSAQEIEDLARQGVRELVVDDSVVLTDLARQTAGQFGLRLVAAASAAPVQTPVQAPARPSANGAAHPVPVAPAAAPLPAKPRGCQHTAAPVVANGRAALPAGGPAKGPAANGSAGGAMVDDLVGLVKQMSKR